MKKEMKFYLVAWCMIVLIFNVAAFLLPESIFEKNPDNFWVVYVSLMVGLVGQAVCSFIYASKDKKEERFLALPVVIIGYIALLMYALLALEAITLQFLPTWFTIIVAVVVFAYYTISVIMTMAAAKMITKIDQKVECQTNTMYTLTTEAKNLEQSALGKMKPLAKKIYESIRYSDPMSSDATEELEQSIKEEFDMFVNAVKNANDTQAEKSVQILLQLVNERNEICKRNKK